MAVKKNKEKAKGTSSKEGSENLDDNIVKGGESTVKESLKDAQKGISADDKYNELNDRFLRLYAEFENFRKSCSYFGRIDSRSKVIACW